MLKIMLAYCINAYWGGWCPILTQLACKQMKLDASKRNQWLNFFVKKKNRLLWAALNEKIVPRIKSFRFQARNPGNKRL